jgi:hypothetical protein
MALVVGRYIVTACATVRSIADMFANGGDGTFLTCWAWATGFVVRRCAGYMALVVGCHTVTACAIVRTITDMVCVGRNGTFLTSWAWATGGGM